MKILQDFPLALSVLASAHRYLGSFRGTTLPSTLKKERARPLWSRPYGFHERRPTRDGERDGGGDDDDDDGGG
jgi:hypothetical protein